MLDATLWQMPLFAKPTSGAEKRERAHLNALAGWSVGRRRRVVECRMSSKTGPTVANRIETLEQYGFVGAHGGKVEPSMIGLELEQVDLVLDAFLGRDEVFLHQGLRITNGKRDIPHRTVDRPPDVYHRGAIPQQAFCLFRPIQSNTLGSRFLGVVVVNHAN